mgnify:CR=1 FL=1
MKCKFFFILPIVIWSWSCGNSDVKNVAKEVHPALLNPVVKPYTEAIALDTANADLYFKRAEMLHKIDMEELT